MAAETGSTSIEIQTANMEFTTIYMKSSKTVTASDCNSNRQPEIAIWPPKLKTHFWKNLKGKSGIYDHGELDRSVTK